MKITPKRKLVLEAARNVQLWAVTASFKSSRAFNYCIDFESGNFNAQVDALIMAGYLTVGSRTDGHWGPRYVHITEAGQKAFKNA